ncbi:unnamed protein product [Nippostrongylus brasiliensis]|uniref:Nonsense-mediated mRNA decay protein (inferred by orthology to a C. elegans protein) n=1 Tax=Nippostrongylus brasiliensis TaxID=27835 RepID=A0A0N4YK02_NIPBR|nr:unnamed protein product [Nippostrongylus brasiliensis]
MRLSPIENRRGTLKQDGSTPAAKPTPATTECKARSCCATLKEIILSPTWSNFLIPTTIGIIVYVLYKGLFKSIMDRVAKYCRSLRKIYDQEGINSSQAVLVRKKIRRILSELAESDENAHALEIFWRTSYYDPLTKLRREKRVDDNWFNVMVSVFCGELQCMLAESPRHAAMYNLYLGDLHRCV